MRHLPAGGHGEREPTADGLLRRGGRRLPAAAPAARQQRRNGKSGRDGGSGSFPGMTLGVHSGVDSRLVRTTERTRSMPKTKDKLTGAAGTAKPYVERALHDEELRQHVKQAY